jgi:hypothetical protein
MSAHPGGARSAAVLCVALALALAAGCGAGSSSTPTPSPTPAPPVPVSTAPVLRAIHMHGNWGGNVSGVKNVPEWWLTRLADDHVNWVGIYVSVFNESISDPTVKVTYQPDPAVLDYSRPYTFDDADLSSLVRTLRSRGIEVYLSLILMYPAPGSQAATCGTASYWVDSHLLGDPDPALPPGGPYESRCVAPALWWWNPDHPAHAANVATFWSTYTQVAVKYAALAEQLGVKMYALGSETDRLFRTQPSARFPNHFRTELASMVSAVRARYSGVVTYDQLSFVYRDHPEWWGLDYAASEPLFRDLGLDVVNLSGYFDLASGPVSSVWSVADFDDAWERAFTKYLVPLQERHPGVPIVFGESGWSDAVNVPQNPVEFGAPYVFADANGNGVDDGMEQQRNMYQGFFDVNERHGRLVRGGFWINAMIEDDPYTQAFTATHRTNHIPGTPAEVVIRDAYARWMTAP